MLCAHSKGVRCLKETQEDEKVSMGAEQWGPPCHSHRHTVLLTEGSERPDIKKTFHTIQQRAQYSKGKGMHGDEKPREGRTDLHHGLLVLTVFHLCRGQVNDATLHWVFVTVIDEDIRATDYDKMFSPVTRKWLLEMEVSFLRDH